MRGAAPEPRALRCGRRGAAGERRRWPAGGAGGRRGGCSGQGAACPPPPAAASRLTPPSPAFPEIAGSSCPRPAHTAELEPPWQDPGAALSRGAALAPLEGGCAVPSPGTRLSCLCRRLPRGTCHCHAWDQAHTASTALGTAPHTIPPAQPRTAGLPAQPALPGPPHTAAGGPGRQCTRNPSHLGSPPRAPAGCWPWCPTPRHGHGSPFAEASPGPCRQPQGQVSQRDALGCHHASRSPACRRQPHPDSGTHHHAP